MGKLPLAVVSAFAIGLGCADRESSTESAILESLPAKGLSRTSRPKVCLYWISAVDGSVWRASIDGSVRENALDCRVLGNGRIPAGVYLNTVVGPSTCLLTAGGIPRGAMGSILDSSTKFKRPASVLFDWETTGRMLESGKTPYSFSAKPSKWSATIHARNAPVGHYHPELDVLEFRRAEGNRVRYQFQSAEGKVLGLLDNDCAILLDGTQIVMWDLVADRKYNFAKGWHPILWPRDLRNPERFKLIVKEAKSATD